MGAGMMRFLGIKYNDYCHALEITEEEKEIAVCCLDYDSEFCQKKIEKFLSKYMLRRTKKQVLNQDFVEKEEIVIKCRLNDEERVIYDKNANEAKQQYQKFKTEQKVMSHYLYLLRMLTKLRQICDHPSLVFNRSSNQEHDKENDLNLSNVMDLESNIDALQRVEEIIIKRLNEMQSLIDYECPVCFELTEMNGVMLSNCGHIFCNECVNDLGNECALCRGRFTQRNIIKISHILKSDKIDEKHRDELDEYQNENNHNQQNNKNKNNDYAKYEEYAKKYSDLSHASSKIMALIDRLNYIEQHHGGDKVLVFSNFSSVFYSVSIKLNEHNINHLQFNGSMLRKKRKQILDKFKSSNQCKVLLISAKCASVGLNLMCANHIIFLEPRYNPGLDNQAIGRVWRIGQNKKVYVIRLILEDTVEETMLKFLSKKEDEDSDLVNLKRKSKLKEEDFDVIFDCDDSANDIS